ncbi:MAG: hypothetical protein ABI700_02165 [Chloroflexota bacterium]
MTTTWTIAVDWNKNGSYTDTNDDVTSRVISANWFLGMREAYQDVADNSVLSLMLKNDDRLYSPEYSSSPLTGLLVPFRPVRIQSNDGTTTRTHWTGWIESIQPTVNQYGQRTVQIVATGAMQLYKAAETKIPLQVNKRTDEVIATLLAEVPGMPTSVLDQGKQTLSVAGDNWVRQGGYTDAEEDTFDVYHAISDTVAVERGHFFFDRQGQPTFWNRHHLLVEQTVAATFNDSMIDLDYTFAGIDECKNEIAIVCQPRSIGVSSSDILWQLTDAVILVQAGQTRKIYVKYQDDSANRIGGQNVTLTDVAFSQGTATSSITANANGAELAFTNNGGIDAIVTSAIVRGQKITTFDRIEATSKDQTSIDNYGRRTMRLNLPAETSFSDAQDIADFERIRRSQPRGTVSALKLVSHGTLGGGNQPQQLALTVGQRIAVSETQTAHNSNYYIIGETHQLTMGAMLYETVWYLEPTPSVYPWQLNNATYSILDSTTKLAY